MGVNQNTIELTSNNLLSNNNEFIKNSSVNKQITISGNRTIK